MRRQWGHRTSGAVLLLVAALALPACAAAPAEEQVHAAVAANFVVPFRILERGFEASSPHRVAVTTGSTGALFAQIVAGAPFEVFLAADAERPRRLVEEERAVAGSRFTYARGRLVLWRPGAPVADGAALLQAGDFEHLAVANPATAPYGRAARQTLESLGVWEAVERRLVLGSDVGQAYQFVATGNAELGLLARSQLDPDAAAAGWSVPEALHAPIEQQAVLLARGASDPAALALLAYLRSAEARRVLTAFGYGVE